MNMDIVRVGVVGTGIMGERHTRVYSTLKHAHLVGIADQNVERGKSIAERYATNYFKDYRQLLAEVDAVTIAASTPAHFDLAMEALDHNVNVLVEKPLTETVKQGKELVAKAKACHKILQVGHIERFNPAYMELKSVTEGMKIAAINIRRLSPFDTSNTDVDVILDLMIHDLDLVMDLAASSLEGFNAWGRSFSTHTVDYAVANFSFRNGPIASLFASRITQQKVRAIEVTAEGAYIEADLLGKSLLIYRRTLPEFDSAKYRQESIIERIHVPMIEPLSLELTHFLKSIINNTPTNVPGEAGLKAVQLAQAVSDQISNLMVLGDVTPQLA